MAWIEADYVQLSDTKSVERIVKFIKSSLNKF